MSITVSPCAAEAIRHALAERGRGVGVRIGVQDAGQSCAAYTLEYADEIRESDLAFVQEGVRLIADFAWLPHLDGLVIDYREEGEDQGFLIRRSVSCGGECQCG